MKFSVTHTCGHLVTHAFVGSPEERARREAWLQQRPCQVCWQAEQAQTAAAHRDTWEWPALDGTEADVAWAEVLRAKAIAHNREFQERLIEKQSRIQDDDAMKVTILAAVEDAMRELEAQCDASWWIKNRFDALSFVKRRIAEAIAPILKAREGA